MHVRINLHNVRQPPISYGPMTSHPRGAQIPLILHPFCHAPPPSGGQSTVHLPHGGHHRMCLADGLPAQCPSGCLLRCIATFLVLPPVGLMILSCASLFLPVDVSTA